MHVKIGESVTGVQHTSGRRLCDVRDKLLEKKQKKQRENVTVKESEAWKTFLLIQANQMSADGNLVFTR